MLNKETKEKWRSLVDGYLRMNNSGRLACLSQEDRLLVWEMARALSAHICEDNSRRSKAHLTRNERKFWETK